MSAPLDFLRLLADRLRGAGLRFAVTSGMACVHYGLQQTTKDSDWVVAPEELARLRELLVGLEGQLPPWRVSYRPIFGAPLEEEYHRHGWTTHLGVWDAASGPEHHVDLFGRPPRVAVMETDVDTPMFASRHVVAQMKKTDRDKDWFAVDGLGLQEWLRGQTRALLHLRSVGPLRQAWQGCGAEDRGAWIARRPLLRQLEEAVSDERLERLLHLERALWQCVNRERYLTYQRAWKAFYRRWQAAEEWSWPMGEPFWMQHERILRAARQYGLPPQPLDPSGRSLVYREGSRRAANLAGATAEEMAWVSPPLEEMLP